MSHFGLKQALLRETKSQKCGVTYRKTVPLRKNAKLKGRVEAVTTIRGHLNASYKRFKESQGETVHALPWGTRLENSCVIQHNGKNYVQMKVEHVGKTQYFVDGIPATEEQIAYINRMKLKGKKEDFAVRTFSFDNIKRIKFGGTEYFPV